MESEQRRDVQSDVDLIAFREFVAGLQMMSTMLDSHVQNFAWCAAQMAGDPDAPSRTRGMAEFAVKLMEFGFDTARQAVEENAGVKVNVATPRLCRNIPGIVVGLVDADFDHEGRVFKGIAVVENSKRQGAFVNVKIRPNGETNLLPADQQRDDPETRRLMIDLGLNQR